MFDFDGVLIDTLPACYRINSEQNNDLELEEYKSFFNGNIHDSKRKNGEPRKYHPDFFELYDTYTRELKVPDVLKNIVKELSNQYILAIVSSTVTKSIEDILTREGIKEYFDSVLGADIHTSKVVKIKSILEKYNVDARESVFITDTLGDIKEAKECNVASIAVTWGFHDKENLKKGDPAQIIDDPQDLISAIENVLK